MATLAIPESILTGLIKIATLSEESMQELLSAVNSLPLKIIQQKVFDNSALNLSVISPEESKAIMDMLVALHTSRVRSRVPISTYVEDITESIIEENRAELEWKNNGETLNRFKIRLISLLEVSSLQVIAKAHDVLLENSRIFANARIVSDIRPVFGEKVEELPSAAVIVHMLNLVYYKDGDRQEFVVALDTKDIQQLIDVLERAKTKTEQLQSVIASTNMTYIEVV